MEGWEKRLSRMEVGGVDRMDVPPEQKATPISEKKGGHVSFCGSSLRFGFYLSVCLLRSLDSVVQCRTGTGANSLCESDNHMVGILVVRSVETGHRGRYL